MWHVQTPSKVSTAATIPLVTARQTLSGFSLTTFDTSVQAQVWLMTTFSCNKQLHLMQVTIWCVLQFLQTLRTNIQALSGPVNVSIIPGSIQAGSVVLGTSVLILNGDSNSAARYASAVQNSSPLVFGSYSATVTSISSGSTANPNAQTGTVAAPTFT